MLNLRDLLILVLTRFRRGSRPKSKGLLLIDSARLTLAPGVVVDDGGLRDLQSKARVTLNALGRWIAAQLKGGTTLGSLVQSLGHTYDLGQDQVRQDVLAFISVLHAQQLLSIRQSYLAEAVARVRARRRGRSPYRRDPATPLNVLAGSLRAQLPVAVAALILAVAIQPLVFLPLLRQGSLPTRAMALQATLPLLAYGAILAGSITLHELIHFWTARRLGVPLKSVFVGPGRIGITQLQARSPKNEIVSTAGPVGTALILVVFAIMLPHFHLGYPFAGLAAPILCGAVAVVHLFGLTPWTSDGKQFLRLIGLG